jgi:hypothetical protein
MQIEFDEKEEVLFEEIITLYGISKDIMIYAEEVGGESFSLATEELRHAFDHLMRVFAFKLGVKQADAKYAIENLITAYRHLYRAAYNLLDYLSIYFMDKFRDELKGFSGKTLQVVFPKYYKEIKPYFEVEAPTEISNLRSEKDIGKRNENDLNKYIEIVERFKSYYREIIKIKPSLIEYEKKTRDKKKKSRLWQIFIPIITAIIGALIGWILSIS